MAGAPPERSPRSPWTSPCGPPPSPDMCCPHPTPHRRMQAFATNMWRTSVSTCMPMHPLAQAPSEPSHRLANPSLAEPWAHLQTRGGGMCMMIRRHGTYRVQQSPLIICYGYLATHGVVAAPRPLRRNRKRERKPHTGHDEPRIRMRLVVVCICRGGDGRQQRMCDQCGGSQGNAQT